MIKNLSLKRATWIGPGAQEKLTITSIRKGCTNWFLEVNSLREKTSETIVELSCSYGFDNSLQTK